MRNELRIGGLVRSAGNVDVGSFRTSQPAVGMSVVRLEQELPWRITVREEQEGVSKDGRQPQDRYSLAVDGGTIYFETEADVRMWMEKYHYRKWHRKGHADTGVVGKWVSKHLYQKRAP